MVLWGFMVSPECETEGAQLESHAATHVRLLLIGKRYIYVLSFGGERRGTKQEGRRKPYIESS